MIGSKIKIFIADDYLLIREGIKTIFKNLNNFVIVGETKDLTNLANKVKDKLPDIIIMELNLCDQPIKALIEDIKTISPETKFLIVSDCNCELPVITSIKAGISGFIKKNVTEEELLKAILLISEGKNYFTPEITQLLANGFLSSKFNFSERELEILRLICKGRSNEQIADLLFITEKTVATHRKNIMKKSNIKKSSDLIVWAYENRIIQR